MPLREQLRDDLAAAMRSGETLRRDTLRMALSSLALLEKELKHDATDEEALGVIVKSVKTRRESVDAYTAAGRCDLAAAEEAEIAILAAYLPAQLGDAEVDALVAEAIAATGAASPKEMGKVIGALKQRPEAALIDFGAVSKLVQARLP